MPEGSEVRYFYAGFPDTINRLLKEQKAESKKSVTVAVQNVFMFSIHIPGGKTFQVPGGSPEIATKGEGTHIWISTNRIYSDKNPTVQWAPAQLVSVYPPLIRYLAASELTLPPDYKFIVDSPYPNFDPAKLPFPEEVGLEKSVRDELIKQLEGLAFSFAVANRTRARALAVAMRLDSKRVGGRELLQSLRAGAYQSRASGALPSSQLAKYLMTLSESLIAKGDSESKKLASCLIAVAGELHDQKWLVDMVGAIRQRLPAVDWNAVLLPDTGIDTKVTSNQPAGGGAAQKMTKSNLPLDVMITVDAFLKVRQKQIGELALKYEKKVETQFNKVVDAGDLEAAEAFQGEKKNLDVLKKALAAGSKEASLPDLDADASEALVICRKVWITEKQKIHVKIGGEIQRYLKKLESDLTKTRDFTKAKIILVYRKSLLSDMPVAMPVKVNSKKIPLPNKSGEWIIQLTSENYESKNRVLPQRPVSDKFYYIESNDTLGVLHLNFKDPRFAPLGFTVDGARLKFRTPNIGLAATQDEIRVLHDGKIVGKLRGARYNSLIVIPLDAKKIRFGSPSLHFTIKCGDDAVIILNQKSKFPPELIVVPKKQK